MTKINIFFSRREAVDVEDEEKKPEFSRISWTSSRVYEKSRFSTNFEQIRKRAAASGWAGEHGRYIPCMRCF